MTELKPCPFCGGEARLVEPMGLMSWCVDCPNPSCQVMGRMSGDKDKAVAAWNRRHSIDTEQQQRDELEAHNEKVKSKQSD